MLATRDESLQKDRNSARMKVKELANAVSKVNELTQQVCSMVHYDMCNIDIISISPCSMDHCGTIWYTYEVESESLPRTLPPVAEDKTGSL